MSLSAVKDKFISKIKNFSISKKALKKFFIYFTASILVGMAISMVNIYFHDYIETFDNKIRDHMFQIRGESNQTGSVVIIDIDEKSLNELGQWPWPRNKSRKDFREPYLCQYRGYRTGHRFCRRGPKLPIQGF